MVVIVRAGRPIEGTNACVHDGGFDEKKRIGGISEIKNSKY